MEAAEPQLTPTVLVLVKGLGVGGAERLIADGAKHWDRSRYDYHVAYILPWKDHLVGDLTALGVSVSCLGSQRGVGPGTPWRLWRLVRSLGVNLIHAHLPSAGIISRLMPRVPVVYTEHNLADSYRTATRIANRMTYGLNQAVIAVSEAVAGSIRDFPGPQTQIVPNGVEVHQSPGAAAAAREWLNLSPTDPLVVHVGNIRPHKGHKTLLAAADHIIGQRPDATIVSIGGEKHRGDLDRLRSQAAALGLSDRLRFLGTRDDALSFVAAANIFVNPSDVEGLPVAILEAQALARPVVATRVGGVPSVVLNDVTGKLVEAGDAAELAKQVLMLLESPSEARELGSRAQALVDEHHSLEKMIRRYEQIYDSVLRSDQ